MAEWIPSALYWSPFRETKRTVALMLQPNKIKPEQEIQLIYTGAGSAFFLTIAEERRGQNCVWFALIHCRWDPDLFTPDTIGNLRWIWFTNWCSYMYVCTILLWTGHKLSIRLWCEWAFQLKPPRSTTKHNNHGGGIATETKPARISAHTTTITFEQDHDRWKWICLYCDHLSVKWCWRRKNEIIAKKAFKAFIPWCTGSNMCTDSLSSTRKGTWCYFILDCQLDGLRTQFKWAVSRALFPRYHKLWNYFPGIWTALPQLRFVCVLAEDSIPCFSFADDWLSIPLLGREHTAQQVVKHWTTVTGMSLSASSWKKGLVIPAWPTLAGAEDNQTPNCWTILHFIDWIASPLSDVLVAKHTDTAILWQQHAWPTFAKMIAIEIGSKTMTMTTTTTVTWLKNATPLSAGRLKNHGRGPGHMELAKRPQCHGCVKLQNLFVWTKRETTKCNLWCEPESSIFVLHPSLGHRNNQIRD